jgi:hypothetical protein
VIWRFSDEENQYVLAVVYFGEGIHWISAVLLLSEGNTTIAEIKPKLTSLAAKL